MRKEVWIAPAVFAADQGMKWAAERMEAAEQTVIPGVLALRLTHNTGMAFSLFSGHSWLLGLLGLLIAAGAYLYLRKKEIPRLPFIGLMLMAGGAAGNMADRWFLGYVRDMIELKFVRFAVFNLADAALTVGCGLLILYVLRDGGNHASEDSSAR